MPGGRQLGVELTPCPPLRWLAMPACMMAAYSSVSGACCPGPDGLVGSHPPPPGNRVHWPFQLGYLASSKACAAASVRASAAASAIDPIERLPSMTVLPHCALLLRLTEIRQIRRRLVLARRH